MIGILVVSHGKMAAGMLDTLRMVMGEAEKLDSVSLVMGEDYEVFEAEITERLRALNDGDGVLALVDLFGASPFNVTQKAAHALEPEGVKVRIVSGMNLGMLVEASSMRVGSTLDELAKTAIEAGRMGVDEPVQVVANEDDEDY
ncbi:MAG: PTS sugar transporter subunit IIA [Atopobiaceae bacterium]|nr:PTS sugar transporter subunit IIA [Atopobiaceae bacterium]